MTEARNEASPLALEMARLRVNEAAAMQISRCSRAQVRAAVAGGPIPETLGQALERLAFAQPFSSLAAEQQKFAQRQVEGR